MPELPDVEVFRRTVARTALRRRIDDVTVRDSTMVEGVAVRRLRTTLRGQQLRTTRRHGKHLLVDLSGGGDLVLHFGMTGYVATDPESPRHPHARVALRFADGGVLTLVDQRRLGHVALGGTVDDYVAQQGLGPDALDVDLPELRDLLVAGRGGLKATLTDQSRLAGLGNIYADEVLFAARLDPRAKANALDARAYRRLHRQLGRVLRLAIERHAQPEQVPRSWLLRHREDGASCPRCGGTVRRLRVGGRAGYWCPACQGG